MIELDFSAIVKFMRDNCIKQCEKQVWLGKKKDLQVLSDRTSAMGKYLVDFLQLSSKKHILEKKNMGNYSAEALVSSITITTKTSC